MAKDDISGNDQLILRHARVTEEGERVTWGILVKKEPRLESLRKTVSNFKCDPIKGNPEAQWWQGPYRMEMNKLVGWDTGRDDILGTPEAHDVVNLTLYHSVPQCPDDCPNCHPLPCRNCGERRGYDEHGYCNACGYPS
jgi:hypothetical protein